MVSAAPKVSKKVHLTLPAPTSRRFIWPCPLGGGAAADELRAPRSTASACKRFAGFGLAPRRPVFLAFSAMFTFTLWSTKTFLLSRPNLRVGTKVHEDTPIKMYVDRSWGLDPQRQRLHCHAGYVPGAKRIDARDAYPMDGWLWAHTEYPMDCHTWRTLVCHKAAFLLVPSVSDADLCWPSCRARQGGQLHHATEQNASFCPSLSPHRRVPYVRFEVPAGSRHRWLGCHDLTLSPEADPGPCQVVIPYLHGIAKPACTPETWPWKLPSPRKSLLVYVGGTWRQKSSPRARIAKELQSAAQRMAPKNPESLFNPGLLVQSHQEEGQMGWGQPKLYLLAWESYAAATFSWQPGGDSPTRRAFYDSWMVGTIPVVEERAAAIYRRLYQGSMFTTVPFQDVAVVLPRLTFENGTALLLALQGLSEAEIARRRKALAQRAMSLQWGWNCTSGALATAIRTALWNWN